MKLSKILKAICGKIFSSTTDSPKFTILHPKPCRSTPIYDECHDSNPERHPLLVVTNASDLESWQMASAVATQPKTPETIVPSVPATENLQASSQLTSNNSETISLPLVTDLDHTGIIEAVNNAFELAAGRSSTASLAAEAAPDADPDAPTVAIRYKPYRPPINIASFEEELMRLSHDNEHKDVQIINLQTQLQVAERKALCLQASKLPRQRILKNRICDLIEEVQSKERLLNEWRISYQRAMREARLIRESDGAIVAMRDDVQSSTRLLKRVFDELRSELRQAEREKKTADRKRKRSAMGSIEEEFDRLMPQPF